MNCAFILTEDHKTEYMYLVILLKKTTTKTPRPPYRWSVWV